jgi:hypothetical protein
LFQGVTKKTVEHHDAGLRWWLFQRTARATPESPDALSFTFNVTKCKFYCTKIASLGNPRC